MTPPEVLEIVAEFDDGDEVELADDFGNVMDGASVRLTRPNSRMFQTATLTISSSFEDGILASSMRFSESEEAGGDFS